MRKYGLALCFATLTGCASLGNTVISDEALKEKAAFALGTSASKVTISNRRSEGLATIRFTAKVRKRSYQCYITTAYGLASSDALCNRGGGRPAKKKSCNALLKAAGRC